MNCNVVMYVVVIIVVKKRRWEKVVTGMMMTTTITQNDNDDFLADISILLEGNLPSTVKHFEFAFIPTTMMRSPPPPPTTTTTSIVDSKNINRSATGRKRTTAIVDLHVVDDDPGSIRSGHYLWDAAPALCNYLIHHHHHHPCHLSSQQELLLHECQQQAAPTPLVAPQSIIELGAGCGLPSLVALQLYAQSIQCLIVSDRDPPVLERARNSYESTMEKLMHKEKDDNDDGDDDDDDDEEEEEEDGQELVLDCRDQLGSIPVAFETLEWGCHNDIHHRQQSYSFLNGSPHIQNILSSTNHRRRYETGGGISNDENNYLTIDLILGSDLIDCIEIVEPLFHTAYDLMHEESILILSQSFLYDSETESKIKEICNELLLERIIRFDNLSKVEEMHVPLKEEDTTTYNRNEGVNTCSGRNNSNENNETRTLLPGGGRYRIQEFKRQRI